MSHPQELSLREQARAVGAGELDSRELLAATLERIAERDGALNSVVDVFAQQAGEMLAAAPPGPLHGVPVTLKDMFALPWRGARNGTAHELLPAGPSGVFARLRDAGAVVAGVTNQHYLALGTTGIVSAYGPVRNPWDPRRVAGGSSGGSAACVGARLVAGSLGSDSGGSTRLPASYCGVVGLKLTFGRTPREGYIGAGTSASAGGIFARDAADTRLLTEVITPVAPPADAAGTRVGLPRGFLWEQVDPRVVEACRAALAAAGWTQGEPELDGLEHAPAAGLTRIAAEFLVALPRAPIDDADPLLRAQAKYLALSPAMRLVRADRVRAQLRRSLTRAFAGASLLAWPSAPAPAPAVDNPTIELPDGPALADPANIAQSVLANLAGVPAISVPVGFSAEGLPIGLTLAAPWGAEGLLLDAAEHLERATARSFVDASPPL